MLLTVYDFYIVLRYLISYQNYSLHHNFFLLFDFQGTILYLIQGSGGDEEDRTPDPLLARQVLSQLSYTPTNSLARASFRNSFHRPAPKN